MDYGPSSPLTHQCGHNYFKNVCIFTVLNLTFAVLILVAMLAVVKIAGQQFKVQEGQSLYVPHLQGNTGDKVEFSEVLLVDNAGTISVGSAVKATVKAEIISDLVQGDKVIAFKMKRRKGFRKKHGHRTHYTRIKIESIA
jgi:large subunit ribosomal protein L21